MTVIETGDSKQRPFFDAERGQVGSEDRCVSPVAGALVIIGPTSGELAGIDALLSAPCVEPVEAIGARLANWKTVSAEVVEVGRSASRAIRRGNTAVVYLDSHSGEAPPVDVAKRDFVCTRLGQVLIGLADVPSGVVAHSERMARALIFDALEDPAAEPVDPLAPGYPVWSLSEATMFPGVKIAMCPGDRPADPIIDLLSRLAN